MIMLSHPQEQSELLPQRELVLPHPPQKNSKMMIQIMELHPHPLLERLDVPHPQFVAVKSLIALPPKGFCLWFIICTMACMCFLIAKIFCFLIEIYLK